MMIRAILISAVLVLLIVADTEARKTSGGRRGGGGGWSLGSRSRTTPRPRNPSSHTYNQQTNQGGSSPNKVGWNVPQTKPSAPVSEQSAKTSATNVQSGYNPSGGYPRQPASNPSYPSSNVNQHSGQAYNPTGGQVPSYGGYNPSGQHYNPSGQAYNPSPMGHSYNSPSMGHPYSPPGGQPYNPSFGHPSYNPSYGHSPYGGSPLGQQYSPSIGQMPQQTILLQSGQSRPGIGQLAKEAFVFAGVSAGVNAAVNRILPGGIYGNRGTSSGSAVPVAGPTHTEITYNNYYNNGSAPVPSGDQAAAVAPANNAPIAPPAQPANQPAAEATQTAQNNAPANNAPANNAPATGNSQGNQQNNPNPLGYITSDQNIKKLTESLFEKDVNNAYKQITMKLQGQKKDDSTTDDAPEPLLEVKPEVYEIPTIKALLSLHDNYELDVKTKETVTPEERREESEFLDKVLETEVMKSTMKFLSDEGYIPNDEYEFKDSLKRIWFSQFKRTDGEPSSSGFETVFLAEKFDSDIIGLHNWIYYARQEAEKKLNYLGYIKEVKLGDKGAVVKVRSSFNDVVQPFTTILVGTSPELELALYSMCFFTRPNNACPISLGGTEFIMVANRVNYFGKDILIAAYPDI